jgi:predicted RNA methylase
MPNLDDVDSKFKQALDAKLFGNRWTNSTSHPQVSQVLRTASKQATGNPGTPDYLNINANSKLLVIAEFKTLITDHRSSEGQLEAPVKFAVDGVRWYMSRFLAPNMSEGIADYFSDWKIVGLACSGDLEDKYGHLISTFTLADGLISEQRSATGFLDESDYVAMFERVDAEAMASRVSDSSRKLNRLLRNLDSQKRPVLLAGCIVALFEAQGLDNSFIREFESNSAETILEKLPARVTKVLSQENVPEEKSKLLTDQLRVMASEPALSGAGDSNLPQEILRELKAFVLPLFDYRGLSYDIIGKFYADFLKYAGIANVKNGIVLTPAHITDLFTSLVDMKPEDVVLDTCCGTGSFLISAMNALNDLIESTDWSDKIERQQHVKERQLVGFEISPLMYSLAISSMLFRGDGKSQIFHLDSFTEEADAELASLSSRYDVSPTIGFINPPYGGKDSAVNPTKKEIQFLQRILDLCSRYVVIIAPLSTYFQESALRKSILRRHTLRRVINMPTDLFQPNASADTAVAVFETKRPHVYANDKVFFYDMADDGFVLAKGKGRTDLYGRWDGIRSRLMSAIADPNAFADNVTCVYKVISPDDEWIIQDHSVVDYSKLTQSDFERSLRKQLIFKAKQDVGLLGVEVDEIELLDVLSDYYGSAGEDA